MGDAYIGIPKAVRIGCYPFRIEVGEIEDHETAGTFGHMNPISQKIRLRPGMSAQKLANAFIHEVLQIVGRPLACDDAGQRGTAAERCGLIAPCSDDYTP